MRIPHTSPSRPVLLARGAVVLLVLALLAGLGLTALRLRGDAAHAQRDRGWAHLLQVAAHVEAVTLDETNVVVGLAIDGVDPADDAGAMALARQRASVVDEAIRRVQDLAGTPGVPDSAAEALLGLYGGLADLAGQPMNPDEGRFVADEQIVVLSAIAADEQQLALLELIVQPSLPRVVLDDVHAVTHLHTGQPAPAFVGVYFEGAESHFAGDDVGWLDPDAPAGTLVSPHIEREALEAHLADEWADVQAALDPNDVAVLVEADDWVAAYPDGSATPPVPRSALMAAAASAASAMDQVAAGVVLQRQQAASDAAVQADQRFTLALIALAVTLLAALAVAGVLARRHWGRVTRWREAALADQLTGLPNRRALREIAAAHPEVDTGHALLLFDLDHFKGINDTHGHSVGDLALRTIAIRAGDVCVTGPGEGVAARLGGDEFVVMLTGLDDPGAQAAAVAAHLVDTVRSVPLVAGGTRVDLSISVGIATAFGPIDLDGLLDQADAALYEVKRNGRGHHKLHEQVTQAPS